MNIKTRGIVFHHIRYSDTSLIVTIYTESSGRKSFLIKGVYKPRSLVKPGFFQPLSLLSMEISLSAKRELQRIREISPSPLLTSMHSQVNKQAIVFFIAEILYKTVKEEEPNKALFGFLDHSVQYLDACGEDVSNFHLIFLVQLSRFLGFLPLNNYSDTNNVFDTLNGSFVPENTCSEYICGKRISARLHTLLNLNYENSQTLALNRTERIELLELILGLYNLHLHAHLNIQSLQVLKELFD